MFLPSGNSQFKARYFVCEFRMDLFSPYATLYINLEYDFACHFATITQYHDIVATNIILSKYYIMSLKRKRI